jgi:hypothetical protein
MMFVITQQKLVNGTHKVNRSQGLYLHGEQRKHNKLTQTSASRVRFEPTIQVFQREKTVHALERVAAVNGIYAVCLHQN